MMAVLYFNVCQNSILDIWLVISELLLLKCVTVNWWIFHVQTDWIEILKCFWRRWSEYSSFFFMVFSIKLVILCKAEIPVKIKSSSSCNLIVFFHFENTNFQHMVVFFFSFFFFSTFNWKIFACKFIDTSNLT
jgi:hypothetical protein